MPTIKDRMARSIARGTQLVATGTLATKSKVPAASHRMFGIPNECIVLILPIDHLGDMGRSATNVVGKWEGDLGK